MAFPDPSASIAAGTTLPSAAICASSNSTISSSRTRAAPSLLPAPPLKAHPTASRLAALTWPTSSSVCPIPAPSPSATRTSIFASTVYDAYFTDDWRIRPNLTINAGLRWEYGSPITEIYGRLVNLDVLPGFTAVAPVLGSDPIGPLTGIHYPSSLIRPDKRGFEPRVGISWRPIPASTIVVRAGYGIYDDTSVYQTSVLQLAQQSPLSKSLSVENSAACPLTLAHGFEPCPSITANTFAVDPNFRVGYAQTWQLSIQRDLPAALQLTATYLGVKGTRGRAAVLAQHLPHRSSQSLSHLSSGLCLSNFGR